MTPLIGEYPCEICGWKVICFLPDPVNPRSVNCVACDTSLLFQRIFSSVPVVSGPNQKRYSWQKKSPSVSR